MTETAAMPPGYSLQRAEDATRDHQLTGRLSRRGFATLLAAAMPQAPLSTRTRLADQWCEQLMRIAKFRRVKWWPSGGWADTAVEVPTAAVQQALEEVLEATPPPWQRTDSAGTDDPTVESGPAAPTPGVVRDTPGQTATSGAPVPGVAPDVPPGPGDAPSAAPAGHLVGAQC